jgi:hypothetical protein
MWKGREGSRSRKVLAFPNRTGQFTDWPGQHSLELHGSGFYLSRPNEYEAHNLSLVPLWHGFGIKFQWHSGSSIDLRIPFEPRAFRN